MLQPWQKGIVVRIENETPTTRRFWIETPDTNPFHFKPGQFVTLDLPISDKPGKRWRSYSISSWPESTNIFELIIVLLEGGAGSEYLFHQVKVGTELTLRGPQGVFVLPEPIDKDLFLICTGTGIAPFRSMAHHILRENIPHRDIYLIFGCRKFPDSLYSAELRALEEELPGFYYIPTFSREVITNQDHLVRIGYVHQVYEEICQAKRTSGGEPHPAYFYLCGWKNMIDEAKMRITQMGYDRKSIHQELYG